MRLEDAAKKASLMTGIEEEVVISVYRQYWKNVKNHMDSLPLKTDENVSEETFNKAVKSFTFQHLGKLWCDYDRYKRIHKKFNHIKSIKNGKTDKDK